ncbi:glycosyltransferase [Streptomyces rubradiris]|uniref:Glycosyl transferase family 1 n=1 Tax=Streptomyces rubradiris TaxID=285531 RepID=A0ABQ3RP77_STRRR|nr:glycosyltransferase [Streptomyces rubradiris]GHH12142.1 glycosyl transferase family 1 [Streptomyces rubradiris]GHI57649.1 glycosyl transferase family 1 [Streptomyces rubradiris]
MHQSVPALRPRVLHLAQPVDGGVARVVLDLVRAQLAAGLPVAVGCPRGALAEGLRELGAEVRDWPARRSPGPELPGEVRRVVRLVEEVRPALVHAHSAKAGLAARLAVRGRVPTVYQPHAWSFEAAGGLTGALARCWERWGARWADRVVCVSAAERAAGLRAGVRAAYTVVPNGVDTTRFAPGPAVPSPQGAGHETDRPLVVCVGRLCRQKGQDVLLRAWPTVLGALPRARLALVGDGPDREALRLRAHPSVEFAGAVADVVPWYRAADLVVLPSRWEGMALAPLEALGCARPVVLTDVAGARESLPPALAARCLVPPEDAVALARAITGLLTDPPLRAALGEQGHRHVVSRHDVRLTAARITTVYDELLTPAEHRAPRHPHPAQDSAPRHPHPAQDSAPRHPHSTQDSAPRLPGPPQDSAPPRLTPPGRGGTGRVVPGQGRGAGRP